MKTIRYVNLVLAGLLAGALFGFWMGYNPAGLSASTYVEQQQSVIRSLNTLMPLLGLVTILLTITSAWMQKKNRGVFFTLLAAAALLVVSGIVTRAGNQPINALVMTWSATDAPHNWEQLRDQWWSLHIMRATASILAFCLIAWTSITGRGTNTTYSTSELRES